VTSSPENNNGDIRLLLTARDRPEVTGGACLKASDTVDSALNRRRPIVKTPLGIWDADAPLISIGPRVRRSPYFEATRRYGAKAFTIYNHMYMPTSYTDPVTEYWNLVNDVTLWDPIHATINTT